MDPEDVIRLFDSHWFIHEIFKKKPSFPSSKTNPSSSQPRFSSLRSILLRSQSEDMSSFNYGSFSPTSVLFTSTLSDEPEPTKQEQNQHAEEKQRSLQEKKRLGKSKSLSDLEFEELKGFMDLGFVFSEEDKDSSLVEIIPGLQRLGEERESGDERESESNSSSSTGATARRPYLSEAWEELKRKEEKKEYRSPLMVDWKVPSLSDEIDMKDSLKLWAHTVASIVR